MTDGQEFFVLGSWVMFAGCVVPPLKEKEKTPPRSMCVTFSIEISILWYTTTDAEQQGKLIHMVKSVFGLLASVQYLYAIFTYRDYAVLNHKMLLTLMDKINSMQGNKGVSSWDEDSDSEVNWLSWVDTELPEDVAMLEDPDYLLPEEVGENSSVTSSSTKRYNLRRRH
ncbi:hypothetical protein BUALT_Bualt18G0088600 [Buddleja alternifolia]|uniref:Uncharacterized protein n=1 Tax=Buddleja alternifolia TaxID=168488 RepID=A0AAV6W9A9_9LAMI|nr:hypothetical protein BUALT_Bualt18G0088600 [Buddleja alternifolia]